MLRVVESGGRLGPGAGGDEAAATYKSFKANGIPDLAARPRSEGLPADVDFLNRFGIGYPDLYSACNRAVLMGIPSSQVLISRGIMSEGDYFNCLATDLGLEFSLSPSTNGESFFEVPPPDVLNGMARTVHPEHQFDKDALEEGLIYAAPDASQIKVLRRMLKQHPSLGTRMRITTRTANKKALEKRSEKSLLSKAVSSLKDAAPEFSAFHVISVRQALFIVLALQIIGAIVFTSGANVLLVAHLIATVFYLGCIATRFYSAIVLKPQTRRISAKTSFMHGRVKDEHLPVYSVLVALYHEAGQVDRLVDSLLEIEWPREKLEIKIVCEADDEETIRSVETKLAVSKASHIELVNVPVSEPRTKPKALNYALPLCRGEFLVIYDAEDSADPGQLREAYHRFEHGPENLACLQAPLVIHNHHEGWLAKMFAIEYSALFDGLLPMLASHYAPLPLGGTSNHFRRPALDQVRGWDPYNVTEDADLGIRLSRMGFQIGTLVRPTYEEAPIDLEVWLKQRTRWFKGWLQTWLVHMRHPLRLGRELGYKGTLIFHLMVTGMVLSALVHPVLLYFVILRMGEVINNGWAAALTNGLFLLDVGTILFGYLAFGALAWRTLPVRQLKKLRWTLWSIPFFWILLSAAAWRALWHLVKCPHHCALMYQRYQAQNAGISL